MQLFDLNQSKGGAGGATSCNGAGTSGGSSSSTSGGASGSGGAAGSGAGGGGRRRLGHTLSRRGIILDAGMLQDVVCPITQEPMEDPVLAADGHTFERSAIEGGFSCCRCLPGCQQDGCRSRMLCLLCLITVTIDDGQLPALSASFQQQQLPCLCFCPTDGAAPQLAAMCVQAGLSASRTTASGPPRPSQTCRWST